jgi:5-methylcytosine-specific restriction endonuclease McrA
MKYELNTYHRDTPEEELLDDLKNVAKLLGRDRFTRSEYNENGKFSSGTFERRFGNWNKAIEKAGLQINLQRNISDKELFENIEEVWIKLGRQPLYDEIRKPLSRFSTIPYTKRFITWRKALEAFIVFINSDEIQDSKKENTVTMENTFMEIPMKQLIKHTSKRNIKSRLKVQVLMRDGNRCKLCGITVTGENIHFDHIKPWSKGGETVLENLQVLCAEHNLAKSNLEYDEA